MRIYFCMLLINLLSFYIIQGRVKVVRSQPIIDVQNETKFVNQSTEELGCTRPYSHADGKYYKYLSCVYGVDRKNLSRGSLIGITRLAE